MTTSYLGNINLISFEAIQLIANKVPTQKQPTFNHPRVILKVLMETSEQVQIYMFYANPRKLERFNWEYIKTAQDRKKVVRVDLYVAERTHVSLEKIPHYNHLFKMLRAPKDNQCNLYI